MPAVPLAVRSRLTSEQLVARGPAGSELVGLALLDASVSESGS